MCSVDFPSGTTGIPDTQEESGTMILKVQDKTIIIILNTDPFLDLLSVCKVQTCKLLHV